MHLVGLSHQGTPLAVRERAFVPLDRGAELAAELADEGEAVCLSTCNRTELYLVGEDAERRALDALAELSGLAEDELRAVVYRLADEAAALHLFRVAAGLDSMVPGEGEILGQVRTAFEAGTTGPVLDRAVPPGAARGQEGAHRDRDRREPGIGVGGGGRARAAGLRPARGMPGAADRRRSRRRARRPEPRRARREDRVRRQPLAPACRRSWPTRFGGEGLAFERRRGACSARSTWSSPRPARRAGRSTRDGVEAALRGRKGRPLFLIDLAVPRDLDPAIHELDGCFLYDIDDLESVVAASLAGRRREAAPRRGDRRRGGRALPRVAGVARGRAGDRVAACLGRGDSRRRARARPRGSGSPSRAAGGRSTRSPPGSSTSCSTCRPCG